MIDLIIGVLIIYFTYKGYKKGFFVSLISFLSFFISILIALNFSSLTASFFLSFFPETNNLIIGFSSIILTFFLSAFLINKITKTLKYFIDLTLIGLFDDISGGIFGFVKTCLIISFTINLFQYFDISIFEEEIKKSIISYYIMDFAPNTLSFFIDFFPSLEIIVESTNKKELIV